MAEGTVDLTGYRSEGTLFVIDARRGARDPGCRCRDVLAAPYPHECTGAASPPRDSDSPVGPDVALDRATLDALVLRGNFGRLAVRSAEIRLLDASEARFARCVELRLSAFRNVELARADFRGGLDAFGSTTAQNFDLASARVVRTLNLMDASVAGLLQITDALLVRAPAVAPGACTEPAGGSWNMIGFSGSMSAHDVRMDFEQRTIRLLSARLRRLDVLETPRWSSVSPASRGAPSGTTTPRWDLTGASIDESLALTPEEHSPDVDDTSSSTDATGARLEIKPEIRIEVGPHCARVDGRVGVALSRRGTARDVEQMLGATVSSRTYSDLAAAGEDYALARYYERADYGALNAFLLGFGRWHPVTYLLIFLCYYLLALCVFRRATADDGWSVRWFALALLLPTVLEIGVALKRGEMMWWNHVVPITKKRYDVRQLGGGSDTTPTDAEQLAPPATPVVASIHELVDEPGPQDGRERTLTFAFHFFHVIGWVISGFLLYSLGIWYSR